MQLVLEDRFVLDAGEHSSWLYGQLKNDESIFAVHRSLAEWGWLIWWKDEDDSTAVGIRFIEMTLPQFLVN